jgi:hypothetical protein
MNKTERNDENFNPVRVSYKGEVYETGNRKNTLIEIFKGKKFVETVSMKDVEPVILETDPDIVTYHTDITGWLDINRFFRGQDKAMTIYASITHKICACGNLMEKFYTECSSCRHKDDVKRYNKYPFKEWNGTDIVYSDSADMYFSDAGEIEEYCEENDVKPEDLRLRLCKPNYISEIDGSQWDDMLPEDVDHFPKAVQDAIDAFNKLVPTFPPLSYSPDKIRTSYTIEP